LLIIKTANWFSVFGLAPGGSKRIRVHRVKIGSCSFAFNALILKSVESGVLKKNIYINGQAKERVPKKEGKLWNIMRNLMRYLAQFSGE